jgi:hypothetical protein
LVDFLLLTTHLVLTPCRYTRWEGIVVVVKWDDVDV